MLKRHWKLTVGLLIVSGLLVCVGAAVTKERSGKDQALRIDQVPEPVRAAVLALGGTIQSVEMETEEGQTIYEVKALVNGQKKELKFAADGGLIAGKDKEDLDDEDQEEEEEDQDQHVSIDQVPQAVRQTILQAGGQVKEIEGDRT
ncbi:MAG: hypothetical protein QHH07_02405 [Sedimentisphaerales bacterium]|jgi:hypothetical protein|nr:hypothetical protein [Sedimentisphaerales bacterium]